MSVLFILITCSLLLAGGFLAAFLWASRSGQFDDDYTPSVRILFDEDLRSSEIPEKVKKPEKGIFTNGKIQVRNKKT